MKQAFFGIVWGTLIAAAVIFAAAIHASTPIVHTSQSTGKCVLVYSPDETHSCENMPSRYNEVIVK